MNYVVFMGPAVLLFVVIGLIPFFYEIWYSFTTGMVSMPTISL